MNSQVGPGVHVLKLDWELQAGWAGGQSPSLGISWVSPGFAVSRVFRAFRSQANARKG